MKKILIILGIFLLVICLHQAYWYYSLGGNLTIWIHNQSEIELVDDTVIYLDGEEIIQDEYTNDILDYKSYTFKVPLGKHTIKVSSEDKSLNKEISFNSFFMKRVIINFSNEYLESNGDDLNFLTEIHTENIITRKSID